MKREGLAWTWQNLGVLALLVIFLSVFVFSQSEALAKVVKITNSLLSQIPGRDGEDKVDQPEGEVPKELEEAFDNLKETIENAKGNGCIIKHPQFPGKFKGFKIEIMSVTGGTYMRLLDKTGGPVKDANIDNVFPCVVGGTNKDGKAAENFLKFYIDKDSSYKGKEMFTLSLNILITDNDNIAYDNKPAGLDDDDYMFVVDDEHVCFFPTIAANNGWGCDAGELGLDNDCTSKIPSNVKIC